MMNIHVSTTSKGSEKEADSKDGGKTPLFLKKSGNDFELLHNSAD